MISSLVSSILTPLSANVANAGEKSAAQQLEQDRNRPAMATVIAARPVISNPLNPIVDQGGAAGGIDYFHAAKHMLGQAFGNFHDDMHDAFRGLGFGDGMAGKMTKAVLSQTKDALLWGVGFSVKLMTATVSQTAVTTGALSASSFTVSARSVEITVNHATGVFNVDADKVTIESQSRGPAGLPAPHLLDIGDSDAAPVRSLTSALQALERPETLFDDDEDETDASKLPPESPEDVTFTAAAVAVTGEEPAFKGVLPTIDRPTVITRPEYRTRIMVSSMEHFLNDNGQMVSRLRLDAVIPLTDPGQRPADAASA